METLIIRAKGVATGALPKYNAHNIKFVRQGNGSGTITIIYNVTTSQTLTISGGVIVTTEGDVTSLAVTPGTKTLTIRLNSPIGFLNFTKPYTYLFSESNIAAQTEDSPRIDYTHRTTGLNSFSSMLQNNTTFNRPIDGLTAADTVTFVSALNMFKGAVNFNQDISNWDVSKINNMDGMFKGALSFNQDISNWDVSNVTNMNLMFSGALSFNQDISNWDVSNVTIMASMFSGTRNFNQDLSSWNVSNVTNMSSMFSSTVAFNQDLSSWNLNLNVNLANTFYLSSIDAENYGNFLIMMAAKNWTGRTQAKTLGANNVKYSAESASARAALVASGWTITDRGQA